MPITCVASAAGRPLILKIASGTSGFLLRASLSANRASSAAAPASTPIVLPAPHPSTGARPSPQPEDKRQHPAGAEEGAGQVEGRKIKPLAAERSLLTLHHQPGRP